MAQSRSSLSRRRRAGLKNRPPRGSGSGPWRGPRRGGRAGCPRPRSRRRGPANRRGGGGPGRLGATTVQAPPFKRWRVEGLREEGRWGAEVDAAGRAAGERRSPPRARPGAVARFRPLAAGGWCGGSRSRRVIAQGGAHQSVRPLPLEPHERPVAVEALGEYPAEALVVLRRSHPAVGVARRPRAVPLRAEIVCSLRGGNRRG